MPQPGTATGALLTDSGWSSGLTINPSTGNLTVAGNLNITSGQLQLNGVNQFQSGTFAGTLTGFSGTAPSGTFHYTIAGNICTVSLANPSNVSGTSNATTMTLTGLPSVCQPAVQQPAMPCTLVDNNQFVAGAASVFQSGTVTFYRLVAATGVYSATGFTASSTKGMDSTVFTYSLQ